MLLCAAPKEYGQAFAAKPGKTLGCNYFAGLPYRFNTLYAKTCYALAHHTALPVFPGFFPKLFCGRSSSPFFAGKATELRCVCIVGAQTMTKIAMNHEPQTINNPIFVVNS